MIAEGLTGPVVSPDSKITPLRSARTGELAVIRAHAPFQEPVVRGNVFSLTLATTSTTIAAGNIVAAAAAASTQFALFNPRKSGRNLVLLEFGMGIISGTPAAGSVFHGVWVDQNTVAAGTILNDMVGFPVPSVAVPVASAAGVALTTVVGPSLLKVTNFTTTATAAASPSYVQGIDYIDGKIVLPPGTGWAPLHSGAGTTALHSYSVTWEEILL